MKTILSFIDFIGDHQISVIIWGAIISGLGTFFPLFGKILGITLLLIICTISIFFTLTSKLEGSSKFFLTSFLITFAVAPFPALSIKVLQLYVFIFLCMLFLITIGYIILFIGALMEH